MGSAGYSEGRPHQPTVFSPEDYGPNCKSGEIPYMGKDHLQRQEDQWKLLNTIGDWLTVGHDIAKAKLTITRSTQAQGNVLSGLENGIPPVSRRLENRTAEGLCLGLFRLL